MTSQCVLSLELFKSGQADLGKWLAHVHLSIVLRGEWVANGWLKKKQMGCIDSTYEIEDTGVSTLLAKRKAPQACQGLECGLVSTIGQWCPTHLQCRKMLKTPAFITTESCNYSKAMWDNSNLYSWVKEDSSIRHVTTKTTATPSRRLGGLLGTSLQRRWWPLILAATAHLVQGSWL